MLHYSYDVLTNNLTQVLVTNANGTTHVYGINPTHSYLDLGTVLTPGENTITIKVCGDLNNRKGGRTSLNGLTDSSLDLYTVGDAVVQPVDTAILDKVILAAEQAIESGEVDKAIESVQVLSLIHISAGGISSLMSQLPLTGRWSSIRSTRMTTHSSRSSSPLIRS